MGVDHNAAFGVLFTEEVAQKFSLEKREEDDDTSYWNDDDEDNEYRMVIGENDFTVEKLDPQGMERYTYFLPCSGKRFSTFRDAWHTEFDPAEVASFIVMVAPMISAGAKLTAFASVDC